MRGGTRERVVRVDMYPGRFLILAAVGVADRSDSRDDRFISLHPKGSFARAKHEEAHLLHSPQPSPPSIVPEGWTPEPAAIPDTADVNAAHAEEPRSVTEGSNLKSVGFHDSSGSTEAAIAQNKKPFSGVEPPKPEHVLVSTAATRVDEKQQHVLWSIAPEEMEMNPEALPESETAASVATDESLAKEQDENEQVQKVQDAGAKISTKDASPVTSPSSSPRVANRLVDEDSGLPENFWEWETPDAISRGDMLSLGLFANKDSKGPEKGNQKDDAQAPTGFQTQQTFPNRTDSADESQHAVGRRGLASDVMLDD